MPKHKSKPAEEPEEIEESEESSDWSSRKSVKFIQLSRIAPEDRKIINRSQTEDKFNNIEKIQFKCQPKSRDSNHTSLDTITKRTPVKEIIYRLIVNNRRSMKLGDIVDKTVEIIKERKPSGFNSEEEVFRYFYRILKEDTYYGFEEVE